MKIARRVLLTVGLISLCCLSYLIILSVFNRGFVKNGKATIDTVVGQACRAYLDYAKFSSTNGKFGFDLSTFSQFAETNRFFMADGRKYALTIRPANQKLAPGERHGELFGSARPIFNSSFNFSGKTNFTFVTFNVEPVIVCKDPVDHDYLASFLGWRWQATKSVYVVGYADGTVNMISPKQFGRLKLDGFVPLSSLDVAPIFARSDEVFLKQ